MDQDLAGDYIARTHFHTPAGVFVPGDVVRLTHADAELAIRQGTVELSADGLGVGVTRTREDQPERCAECARIGYKPCSVACFVRAGYHADHYAEFCEQAERQHGAAPVEARLDIVAKAFEPGEAQVTHSEPAIEPDAAPSDAPLSDPPPGLSKSQQKRQDVLRNRRS